MYQSSDLMDSFWSYLELRRSRSNMNALCEIAVAIYVKNLVKAVATSADGKVLYVSDYTNDCLFLFDTDFGSHQLNND